MLFSKADQERITAAVKTAEARTAAEFVVATSTRSGHYSAYRAAAAALGTWATGMALHLFALELDASWVFLLQLPLGLAFWGLFGLRLFLLPLVPDAREQAAVLHEAERLYAELGVHRTSGKTGVLIFLSEFERRVQLLGDEAVDAALGSQGWSRHATGLMTVWKGEGPTEAVVRTLEALAESLAAPLPHQGQSSQRPDEVVAR